MGNTAQSPRLPPLPLRHPITLDAAFRTGVALGFGAVFSAGAADVAFGAGGAGVGAVHGLHYATPTMPCQAAAIFPRTSANAARPFSVSISSGKSRSEYTNTYEQEQNGSSAGCVIESIHPAGPGFT